ncbi:MAG: hypothetical protein ACK47B_23775 [Armatimonadota bacterium]
MEDKGAAESGAWSVPLTPLQSQMLQARAWLEKNQLPLPGAYTDQHKLYVACMDGLLAEEAEIQAEHRRKLEEERRNRGQ